MLFELSEAEVEMIAGWYDAAAGECVSANEENWPLMQSLLVKLGIEKHVMDETRCVTCGLYECAHQAATPK